MKDNQTSRKRIGVIDSGVGGLTVVKQLEDMLPGEDILYFGDSANCPYGVRPKENLIVLMNRILDYIENQDVKAIVVACNTLSALYDEYNIPRKTPVFTIVSAGARHIIEQGISSVGVIGTEYTVRSAWYAHLIHQMNPEIPVYAAANHELATLVDENRFEDIPLNVRTHLNELRAKGDFSHVILGCTHYPIIQDVFKAEAPDLDFIDPALALTDQLKTYLESNQLLDPKDTHTLEIVTSGNPENYKAICQRIGIRTPAVYKVHSLN